MKTFIKPALWTGLGMLSLTALMGGTNANAFERYERYERPVVVAAPVYQTVMERQWVEGRYEVKCENVLIAPEHKEVRVTPPVLETRKDYYGRPYTVVIVPERREEVCIPAQYEKRETKVWIPGFYQEVAVQQPVYAPPPPVYTQERRPAVVLHGGERNHRGFFDIAFRF